MVFYRKVQFWVVILCAVFLVSVWGGHTALADSSATLALDIDQPITVIGRTPTAIIDISNPGPNAVRVSSLTCTQQGNSVVKSSSFGTPSMIGANARTQITVYYHAVSAGTTNITCKLTGTDAATGTQVNLSATGGFNVLSETRLFFDVYSATKVATVGQAVYITAKFGNRGNTPFTNVSISCPEQGRALVNITSPQPPSTIKPGQSGFVEYKWRAERTGSAHFFCSLTATDSSGNQITLPATPLYIEVR